MLLEAQDPARGVRVQGLDFRQSYFRGYCTHPSTSRPDRLARTTRQDFESDCWRNCCCKPVGAAMISYPHTVATILKSANQHFRVRIIRQGGEPLTRLELLERNRNGEFRARPGTPGVPGRLVGDVAAAFVEAAKLIGGTS